MSGTPRSRTMSRCEHRPNDRAPARGVAGAACADYDVRTAANSRATLLRFFASAYEAGARAAGWDVDTFATRAAPRR